MTGIFAFLALISYKYSKVASGFLREKIFTQLGNSCGYICMALPKAKITTGLH